jgi:hypothetical protein
MGSKRQKALRGTTQVPPGGDDNPEALRQVDILIDRMHREMDSAIDAVTASLGRMAKPPRIAPKRGRS